MFFNGIILGAAAFLTIGIFHPLVIKAEYYFGVRVWWAFLAVGLAAVGVSLFIENIIVSSILGVLGFSCFWSIKEIFEQRRRVLDGRFPRNPKRKY
ncbi:DUF4491 domain-containing protein [Bacteroidia bacterium]|nr:DUF4491 domain-containing protein [Bacteroidia bacterium]